jgi:hypothetical protein
MRKYIAHLVQGANGPLSCECTDTITCGNCVQVNLMLMAKRFKVEDETVKAFIREVGENGIRRTARQMGIEERSLRRWIQGKNFPASVIEKFRALRQG